MKLFQERESFSNFDQLFNFLIGSLFVYIESFKDNKEITVDVAKVFNILAK